jgi:thiamine biosynthesis lipoprotein
MNMDRSSAHNFQRVRPALGTFVSLEINANEDQMAREGMEQAFEIFGRVAELMHPTAAGSDLARIAAAARDQDVAVDRWTYEVLTLAGELSVLTDGLFDPCLAQRPGRMRDLDLSTPNRVRCRAPVAIDLGGIAKGFAVDLAVNALRAGGCEAGLVNAGGDLRVFGAAARSVHVRLPRNAVAQVELANVALAVSSPKSETSPAEHRGFYRGTDGEFVEGRVVAVVAAKAAVADALTKCVMLCSAQQIEPVLRRYEARVLSLGI